MNVRPFLGSEVSSLTYPYAPFLPREEITEHERVLKENSFHLLKDVAKILQEVKIHVKAVALRGDPREALEMKIEKTRPTMVVMGNRGKDFVLLNTTYKQYLALKDVT